MWAREIMASEEWVVSLDSMFALPYKEIVGSSLLTRGDNIPLCVYLKDVKKCIYDILSGSL